MPPTDARCRSQVADAKLTKVSDGAGLQLWVQPNDARLWRIAYRFKGKQKLLALGVYPTLSLARAGTRRGTRPRRGAGSGAMTVLTRVELLWLEGRVGRWIRFGRIAEETILDRRRRVVATAEVFAFVRWASNGYGTVVSRIDILRAVAPGEAYSTIGFRQPEAEILLRISGWPKVNDVLRAIDAVEQTGVAPEEALAAGQSS